MLSNLSRCEGDIVEQRVVHWAVLTIVVAFCDKWGLASDGSLSMGVGLYSVAREIHRVVSDHLVPLVIVDWGLNAAT